MPIFVSSSFEDLKHRVYMALGRSPGSRVSRAAAVLSKHQKDDAEGGQPSVFIIGLGLSIPDHTTMEAYRAMAECRLELPVLRLVRRRGPIEQVLRERVFCLR